MAATTGTRLNCNTTTLCNTTTICGQGATPEAWVIYSTDDVSVSIPTWTDATSLVRSFNVRRGRDNELSEIDAGQAVIVLDNRARTFDPVANAAIRPLNRWWIREQFSGETQDIYYGYAESYEQGWEGAPNDATATVSCADEFKVLQLYNLPVTDPPRDTYQDVVLFDNPAGYWPIKFVEQPTASFAGLAGDTALAAVAASANLTGDPIIGQDESTAGYVVFATGSAGSLSTGTLAQGGNGDVAGLSEFALEAWIQFTSNPAGTRTLITGPNAGGASTYVLKLTTTPQFSIEARNSVGTNATVTGGSLTTNTWYHVVATIESGTLKLYINGSLANSGAFTGTFATTIDANQAFTVYDAGANIGLSFDEIAVYRTHLGSGRVSAHYTAGASRGFVRNQLPRDRFNGVLDSITSHAPRRWTTPAADNHNMQGIRMRGQPPLDDLRTAKTADNINAILFTARDGTLTFLDYDYRSGSPYTSAQATFGDGGGSELPYRDLTTDYSDTYLANVWNVTRINGTLQTTSDTTSTARYGTRPQSIDDLPVVSDSVASSVATSMLAKYKDPFYRITSITLTTGIPDVAQAAFSREIGDCIRILRTPPGGGSRIDQTSFIQSIQVDATPNRADWRITWNVSPL